VGNNPAPLVRGHIWGRFRPVNGFFQELFEAGGRCPAEAKEAPATGRPRKAQAWKDRLFAASEVLKERMQPLQAAPFRRVFEDEPQGRGLPSYSIFKEWPVSLER
jgi:hypothetical protein